jgi:hypothetical protein
MANLSELNLNKLKRKDKLKNYAFFEKEFQQALDAIKEVDSDIYFQQKMKIIGNKILSKENFPSQGRHSSISINESSPSRVKKLGDINWLQILEVCAIGCILYLLTYFK